MSMFEVSSSELLSYSAALQIMGVGGLVLATYVHYTDSGEPIVLTGNVGVTREKIVALMEKIQNLDDKSNLKKIFENTIPKR